jgi:hypothetical protein
MINDGYMVASMIWSTVGVAYIVWGRKVGEFTPAIGGIALIAISWFISSIALMSLVAICVLTATWYAMRRGF